MTSALPAEFNFPEIIRKAAALFILLVVCGSVMAPLAPKIAPAVAARNTKALRTLDVCNSQGPALSSDHETVYIWESPGKIVLLASEASHVTLQPQYRLLLASARKERPPQA